MIVGGGATDIAVVSSWPSSDASLDIAIINPTDIHYDQPGWTMAGTKLGRPALIPNGDFAEKPEVSYPLTFQLLE